MERIIYSATRASSKHPERNEDSFFVAENGSVGVFDGLGGRAGSEAASAEANRVCSEHLGSVSMDERMWPIDAQHLMHEALTSANSSIRELGVIGIATTAMIGQVYRTPKGQQFAQFAYSGDSRAYVLRRSRFISISLDHAASMRGIPEEEAREIQDLIDKVERKDQLGSSRRLFWHWNQRNVIEHCLDGNDNPFISFNNVVVQPGDTIALTTDGIHDNLTGSEIKAILGVYADRDAAQKLVDRAYARSQTTQIVPPTISAQGGAVEYIRRKPDDMTAIVRPVWLSID